MTDISASSNTNSNASQLRCTHTGSVASAATSCEHLAMYLKDAANVETLLLVQQYAAGVYFGTEAANLRAYARPLAVPLPLRGLRGLYNLGNTCFMNSILQTLAHCPPLRNYFLSDQHNRKLCLHARHVTRMASALGIKVESDSLASEICLCCEMDYLMSEMTSGVHAPFSPHQFLYSVWKHSNTFAGYEQQDAHEFFICVLNGIHAHCGGSRDNRCGCVVHAIFSGTLRSDVTCRHCGNTSTATDPFIDISLELPNPAALLRSSDANIPLSSSGGSIPMPTDTTSTTSAVPAQSASSSAPTAAAVLDDAVDVNDSPHQSISLHDALQRFTRPEKLGKDERTFCSHCNALRDSVKQLSMKTLPSVICFHLKRFKQGPTLKHSHKIDTHVSFPATLDMTPYLSDSVISTRLDRKRSYDSLPKSMLESKSTTATSATLDSESEHLYELFAVVNHRGKIDNGHYTALVRHGDTWIRAADNVLTKTTFEEVARTEGYLLFYIRKHLVY